MESYGWVSILPPLLSIFMAIRTKEVVSSILLGLLLGGVIVENYNPLLGFENMINSLISVFEDPGSTKVVVYTLLIGAVLKLVEQGGGTLGLLNWVKIRFEQGHDGNNKESDRRFEWYAMLTGVLIFIETNISILTTGNIFKPLFDRFGLSRSKLAYILDSTSSPASILLPFNAWGAYILSLLVLVGVESPMKIFWGSIVFNIYPIAVLGLVAWTIRHSRWESIKHKGSDNTDQVAPKMGNKWLFIVPVFLMVFSLPFFLYYTGLDADHPGWLAITNGSGSSAVLYSVVLALCACIVFMIAKGNKISVLMNSIVLGMSDMLSMGILMVLAFALGSMCKSIGTGQYVASIVTGAIPSFLIPTIIFTVSAFVAFSTGTSWGTFAIMIAIVVPLSQEMNLHLPLLVAAVLGGGVFGDHCSPISDTTILSSMAAGCDHIEHVRTQLPYALMAGVLSIFFYLVLGVVLS